MDKLWTTKFLFVTLLLIAGCSDNPGSPSEPEPPEREQTGSIPDEVEPDVDIITPGTKISQLVGDYDRERDQQTQNRTYTRYQLRATDLGVPFRSGDRTYILFGDTWGAVGNGRDVIAYTTDTDPEDGLSLNFFSDSEGVYLPISIPGISQGAFEVPTEGVVIDNQMYIYHSTDHNPPVTMGRSVVARSTDGGQTFTKLYDLSTQYFINVSIVKSASSDWTLPERIRRSIPDKEGEGLIIFGSGSYRKSNVYLAYQSISEIGNSTVMHYFSGIDENGEPLWSSLEPYSVPIFEQPCIGELSASYNSFIDRWILLYNCGDPRGINIRTARFPWGPWTEPQVVFEPWADGGYCHYMHTSWQHDQCDHVHDAGRENVWGGEYGPYQFEHFATGDSLSTTIYFTMSTWNPYTVVLMKARLKKDQ